MKKPKIISLIVGSALIFAGSSGAYVAYATSGDDGGEPEAIAITESKEGFEFQDQNGIELETVREISSQAETVKLQETSEGGPVLTVELSALPSDPSDNLDYETAVAEAQEEIEPDYISPDSPAETFRLKPEETKFDETKLNPVMSYATTPSSVNFYLSHGSALLDANEEITYTIIRDGESLGSTSENTFVDNQVDSNSNYVYEVIETASESSVIGSKSPVLATTSYLNVTTPQSTLAAAIASPIATAAATVWTSAYMHTTFIKDKTVSMGFFQKHGCGTWPWEEVEFSGDGRSSKIPSVDAPNQPEDYRSMMYVNINWENPSPYNVIWTRNVGVTKKFINGKLSESRKAAMTNMIVDNISANSTYAQVVVKHTLGNPFCAAGAITYQDEVRFYRNSNTIQVNGWRFPVPNHEISTRYDAPGSPAGVYWLPANWLPSESFDCLLGYCTRDSYTSSMKG